MDDRERNLTFEELDNRRVRGVFYCSNAWRVKIVHKGETVIDRLFTSKRSGSPLDALMDAITHRNKWYKKLGLDCDKPPIFSRKRKQLPGPPPRWKKPRTQKNSEEPAMGIRKCVREGEDGFVAYQEGRREMFYSIAKWGEETARQLAETRIEMWEKDFRKSQIF